MLHRAKKFNFARLVILVSLITMAAIVAHVAVFRQFVEEAAFAKSPLNGGGPDLLLLPQTSLFKNTITLPTDEIHMSGIIIEQFGERDEEEKENMYRSSSSPLIYLQHIYTWDYFINELIGKEDKGVRGSMEIHNRGLNYDPLTAEIFENKSALFEIYEISKSLLEAQILKEKNRPVNKKKRTVEKNSHLIIGCNFLKGNSEVVQKIESVLEFKTFPSSIRIALGGIGQSTREDFAFFFALIFLLKYVYIPITPSTVLWQLIGFNPPSAQGTVYKAWRIGVRDLYMDDNLVSAPPSLIFWNLDEDKRKALDPNLVKKVVTHLSNFSNTDILLFTKRRKFPEWWYYGSVLGEEPFETSQNRSLSAIEDLSKFRNGLLSEDEFLKKRSTLEASEKRPFNFNNSEKTSIVAIRRNVLHQVEIPINSPNHSLWEQRLYSK